MNNQLVEICPLLFLALLTLVLPACGQAKLRDCNTLLEETPYFLRQSTNESIDLVQLDFAILNKC